MPWLHLDHALIRLSGPEARAFLDNLVTQDLGKLGQAPVVYAGLLTPQGKVVADFLVWADGDALVIETPARFADDLKRKLLMYRLRSKVEISGMDWIAAVNLDGAAAPPAGLSAPDPRAAALGRRWIGPPGGAGLVRDDAALLAARLAFGAPDLSVDAGPEEVFALEALFEELNGVAFDKGCFVGQENVSRMKRRATTRKKFCPIAAPMDAAFGDVVMAEAAALGAVRSAHNGRALALLRLDRAQEAIARGVALRVRGAPVTLDPPPWLKLPPSGDEP